MSKWFNDGVQVLQMSLGKNSKGATFVPLNKADETLDRFIERWGGPELLDSSSFVINELKQYLIIFDEATYWFDKDLPIEMFEKIFNLENPDLNKILGFHKDTKFNKAIFKKEIYLKYGEFFSLEEK